MLSQAFKVVRMDFKWNAVESVCGQYNFTAYDTLLTTMQAHGLRPYWILDYGNTCYPPQHPLPIVAKSCSTPTCIAAFAKFAAAAAARYQGNGIIFECLNEPNGMGNDNATDITELCLAASKGIRSQPLTTFVGPATSSFPWQYLNTSIQQGILNAFDALSVHPYRGSSPETVLADYTRLRTMVALPIISGEWGYTTATLCIYPNRCDETTQAAYLARGWLINTLANVSISIDYDWSDGSGVGCESKFGSVRFQRGSNGTPFAIKPKYMAAKTLQTTLGNYENVGQRIDVLSTAGALPQPQLRDVFVLSFLNESSSSTGFAVWSNGTKSGGKCSTRSSAVPIQHRLDCGHVGISKVECLSASNPKASKKFGCCWEHNVAVVGGPQCYSVDVKQVTNATVSFRVGDSAHDSHSLCWHRVELLPEGRSDGLELENVICADKNGLVNVALRPLKSESGFVDAPVYLLPVLPVLPVMVEKVCRRVG